MPSFPSKRLTVESSFYLYSVLILLLIPFKLALAWVLAVLVHELGHFLALKACSVPICGIQIRGFEVIMRTAPMTQKQELICAVAGPVAGLCLIPLARFLPNTAICAFIQSMYNLLPAFPLDGGRALRCALCQFLGEESGLRLSKMIGHIVLILLALLGVYLTWHFQNVALPFCVTAVLCIKAFTRKISCKESELIVQ